MKAIRDAAPLAMHHFALERLLAPFLDLSQRLIGIRR